MAAGGGAAVDIVVVSSLQYGRTSPKRSDLFLQGSSCDSHTTAPRVLCCALPAVDVVSSAAVRPHVAEALRVFPPRQRL